MWFHLTDKEPEDQTAWLPGGTEVAEVTLLALESGPPGPKLRTTPPPTHRLWFLRPCRDAHRIEAAELVAGHADDHGDDLPADEGRPQQLQHGHQADVPLDAALGQDLLHLVGHIRFAQEHLEGCTQGQERAFSRDQGGAGPATQTRTLPGLEQAGACETTESLVKALV